MRIGELAERSGASVRSIRYYESAGLITSRRAGNGYREFETDVLDQVASIRLLLQVGLDVRDIAAVLPCVDTPEAPRCSHAQRRYDEQIERIERRQQVLDQARSLLMDLRAGRPRPVPADGGTVRVVSGNVTLGL
ncbi:MerR family transcriptional regulator [Cellulomonas sp. URHB0016]